MGTRKPKVIYSDFCGLLKQKAMSLEILIVQVEGSHFWTLKVHSECGTNYTCDNQFLSDCDAYLAFARWFIEGKFNYEGEFGCIQPDHSNVIMYPERRPEFLPPVPNP